MSSIKDSDMFACAMLCLVDSKRGMGSVSAKKKNTADFLGFCQ